MDENVTPIENPTPKASLIRKVCIVAGAVTGIIIAGGLVVLAASVASEEDEEEDTEE